MRPSRFARTLTCDMVIIGALAFAALLLAELLGRGLETVARGEVFSWATTQLRLPLLVYVAVPIGAATATARQMGAGAARALDAAGVGWGPWLSGSLGAGLIGALAFTGAVRAAPESDATISARRFWASGWWLRLTPPDALGGPGNPRHLRPSFLRFQEGHWAFGPEGPRVMGPSPQALRAAAGRLGTRSTASDLDLAAAARAWGQIPFPHLAERNWRRIGPLLLLFSSVGACLSVRRASSLSPRAGLGWGWLWGLGSVAFLYILRALGPGGGLSPHAPGMATGVVLAGAILLIAAPWPIRRSQRP